MSLDTATLFTVATCVTGLLGLFILAVWMQERSSRALAWWGAAYLMGGSAVALWGVQDATPLIAPFVPNALLFIACGVVWNGARIFHGHAVRPLPLCVGAMIWTMAMHFPAFAEDQQARVVLSSIIIASYIFLTALELRRERRASAVGFWLAPVVALLHSLVFLSPIPLSLMSPPGTSTPGWSAVLVLETLLYVVGTAFIVVIMTKERVALGHKTAAMTDPLTGLFNRRAFFEAAHAMMDRQARSRAPVSVLVFDLDHFKSINDRFGHAIGDEALRVFAATAKSNVRSTDVIARLGGEEFVALLPGGPADAALVAERLRAAFQAAAVEVSAQPLKATVSIGAASALAPADTELMLERADVALYAAKTNGRNRVEMAADDPAAELAAPAVNPRRISFRAAIARWNQWWIFPTNGTFTRV